MDLADGGGGGAAMDPFVVSAKIRDVAYLMGSEDNISVITVLLKNDWLIRIDLMRERLENINIINNNMLDVGLFLQKCREWVRVRENVVCANILWNIF